MLLQDQLLPFPMLVSRQDTSLVSAKQNKVKVNILFFNNHNHQVFLESMQNLFLYTSDHFRYRDGWRQS